MRKVHELKPDYISDGQTRFIGKTADADLAIGLIARRFFGVGASDERSAFIRLTKSLRWSPVEDRHLNASVTPPEFVVTDSAIAFIRSINREDKKLYKFVLSVWRNRR